MSDWSDIEEDMGGHNPETGMPYFIEDEIELIDIELRFTWTYNDYLVVTEREDNEDTAERWVEVVSLIDNKHYDGVHSEIVNTIMFIDKEILEEEV